MTVIPDGFFHFAFVLGNQSVRVERHVFIVSLPLFVNRQDDFDARDVARHNGGIHGAGKQLGIVEQGFGIDVDDFFRRRFGGRFGRCFFDRGRFCRFDLQLGGRLVLRLGWHVGGFRCGHGEQGEEEECFHVFVRRLGCNGA